VPSWCRRKARFGCGAHPNCALCRFVALIAENLKRVESTIKIKFSIQDMARQQSAKKTGVDAVVASSRKRAAPPEVSESVEDAGNGLEDFDECSSYNDLDDVSDEPLDDEEWVAIENELPDF
jgi:hypothetical protein